KIARQIEGLGIDCDFRRGNAHVYTTDTNQFDTIEKEVEAAITLGLPAAFTGDTELPYSVLGALRFENQATFHPRKYCLGLAKSIPGDGSDIFEHTRATDVECNGSCVIHAKNGTITAGHVVMATQIPFLDRGGYFARTSPA